MAMTATGQDTDRYQRSGLFLGGRTNDTRTTAQKLIKERGSVAPLEARPKVWTGTVDWRRVGGTDYQVGLLHDWYAQKLGARPMPAWDVVRGRLVEVRTNFVLVRVHEEGSSRPTPQIVAVRNWPGEPARGTIAAVYAMKLTERFRDHDGQPILVYDCGLFVDGPE
jgi:hypothetical protein